MLLFAVIIMKKRRVFSTIYIFFLHYKIHFRFKGSISTSCSKLSHYQLYLLKKLETSSIFRGRIHHTDMYDMLRNIAPPVGFGRKCPYRLAYKHLIRMNMPVAEDGTVHFTTTLFCLIRESLSIKMRPVDEMDQADEELRMTLKKIWPLKAKKNMIDLVVPPDLGESWRRERNCFLKVLWSNVCIFIARLKRGSITLFLFVLQLKNRKISETERCRALVIVHKKLWN